MTTADNQRLELSGFRSLLARLDTDPVRRGKPMKTFGRSWLHISHTIIIWKLMNEPRRHWTESQKSQTCDRCTTLLSLLLALPGTYTKKALRKTSLRTDVPDMEIIEDTTRGNGCRDDAIINRISVERKLQCFQKSMQNLSGADREMVRRYYPPASGDLERKRADLAAEFGLIIGALRTRMAYIRRKLQDQFDRHYNRPEREQTLKRDSAPSNFCALKDSNSSGQYKGAAIRIEAEEQRSVNARLWRLQDGVRDRSEGSA